ncbi:MAG: bifunctional riboflavin kinase/FMN adenylyltransferase, partial [Bacteroidetes bacterium]|nr:bifunctional riboflavin kinase/FMN adenylyltransferase [Bacteroidota bacterium]
AIRNALHEDGDMELAASLLEKYYILNGTVVHGDKRGKKIGFPTANIKPQNEKKVIPKKGVYAVWVRFEDSYYKGMMNIGERPTFNGEAITLEVHILDFNNEIYGKDIQVQFVKRIRDEKQFNGLEELKNQLYMDKEDVKSVLGNSSPNIAKHMK